MLKRNCPVVTWFVLLIGLLSACTSQATSTGTPQSSPTFLPPNPPTRAATLTVTPAPMTPSVTATSVAPTATPVPVTLTNTPAPTSTPKALPAFTLKPGDFYFSLDNQPSFIFSRNIAGYEDWQYATFLEWTQAGGSQLARLQLDSLGMGYTPAGAVDEAWAQRWEQIFDRAAANGIYILPVFSGWFDWNAGAGYSTWKSNPLNETKGGPVKTPAELFQKDSATQTLWLNWLQTLVQRWHTRKNIAAWEIFSEVNLATGATERTGIDFVDRAAAIIRAADPSQRAITASLADDGQWPNFYGRASIDFVNVHPYPPSGQLDRNVISGVRQVLATYNKPVLIGESGLSAETPDSNPPTLTTAANAAVGIKHAIWAGVVSGAMNGRALYWEDSFAIYFPALNLSFVQQYADADRPASNFVRGVDFSGFKPLPAKFSEAVFGAAVGNEKTVLGWFRDAKCEPPDWKWLPTLSQQSVTIVVPGSASQWKVDFYDTQTGTDITASATVARKGSGVTITLPDFTNDIAFKMYPLSGTESTPAPAATTDSIAGKWTGTLANEAGTFSTHVDLSIQSGCQAGQVCGTVSAPQLPCSGNLFLQEITGETFLFVEQNMQGAAVCSSGGYEYVQLQADGTLALKFVFPSSPNEASRGSLKRP